MAASISARVAALREAGYAGPVDYLGFAESGDRVADMARNYWAGRDARQEEERQVISAESTTGASGRDGGEISGDLPAGRAAYRALLDELFAEKGAEQAEHGAPQARRQMELEIGQ